MRVYICFDVEDLVHPDSDDVPYNIAEMLAGDGIVASMCVVGEKARLWERRGRADVIAAVGCHDVGLHTDHHSIHPTAAEYLADKGWADGMAEAVRQEGLAHATWPASSAFPPRPGAPPAPVGGRTSRPPLAGAVLGPVDVPPGLERAVTVSADAGLALCRELIHHMDATGHLPTALIADDTPIGPGPLLRAVAAAFLALDHGQEHPCSGCTSGYRAGA